MYKNNFVPIRECSELKLLNRYIHCFCIGKIRKRLAAPILGGSHGCPSLILDQKRFGFVTREQFQGYIITPQRHPAASKMLDEAWLHKALAKSYPGIDFGIAPEDTGAYQLDLNEERA
ncbi:hypothetical protein FRC00_008049, partial [Tulasnella sp. 408]